MKECNAFFFLCPIQNTTLLWQYLVVNINFLFFKDLLLPSVFLYRYGELQGLNKQETADRFGKEQVHEWRRSYDIPPPNGESLEMCAERAVAYFKEHVSIAFPLKSLVYVTKLLILILNTAMWGHDLFLSSSPFLHVL